MKDFICDLLRGASMFGVFVGFILWASEVIAFPYLPMIILDCMLLYIFADWLDERFETKETDENTDAKAGDK